MCAPNVIKLFHPKTKHQSHDGTSKGISKVSPANDVTEIIMKIKVRLHSD